MRKIVIAVMSTVSIMVLVFSFDASVRGENVVTSAVSPSEPADGAGTTEGADGSVAADGGAAGDDGDQAQDDASPSTSSEPAPATSTKNAATSGTFTGDEAQTQWGIVQVRVVIKNGRIVKATALQFPQENHHDVEINSWAIPQLEQATVDNNGQVDSYGGATVTCDGYRRSLQSALDQAHL